MLVLLVLLVLQTLLMELLLHELLRMEPLVFMGPIASWVFALLRPRLHTTYLLNRCNCSAQFILVSQFFLFVVERLCSSHGADCWMALLN